MRAWKMLDNRVGKLPKLSRFWRLTTVRKIHYAVVEHKEDTPMSVDIPMVLWRKAWLARFLNENILLEHYDGTQYGWSTVFYWPARKLQKPEDSKKGREFTLSWVE